MPLDELVLRFATDVALATGARITAIEIEGRAFELLAAQSLAHLKRRPADTPKRFVFNTSPEPVEITRAK